MINNEITNSFCCCPLAAISQSTGIKRFCGSDRIRVQVVAPCGQTGSPELTVCSSSRFLGSEMMKCPFSIKEKHRKYPQAETALRLEKSGIGFCLLHFF